MSFFFFFKRNETPKMLKVQKAQFGYWFCRWSQSDHKTKMGRTTNSLSVVKVCRTHPPNRCPPDGLMKVTNLFAWYLLLQSHILGLLPHPRPQRTKEGRLGKRGKQVSVPHSTFGELTLHAHRTYLLSPQAMKIKTYKVNLLTQSSGKSGQLLSFSGQFRSTRPYSTRTHIPIYLGPAPHHFSNSIVLREHLSLLVSGYGRINLLDVQIMSWKCWSIIYRIMPCLGSPKVMDFGDFLGGEKPRIFLA